MQVGDTVTHISEGFWQETKTIVSFFGEGKYARFKEGGWWRKDRLKVVTQRQPDEGKNE